jgi:hypothetical protein
MQSGDLVWLKLKIRTYFNHLSEITTNIWLSRYSYIFENCLIRLGFLVSGTDTYMGVCAWIADIPNSGSVGVLVGTINSSNLAVGEMKDLLYTGKETQYGFEDRMGIGNSHRHEWNGDESLPKQKNTRV